MVLETIYFSFELDTRPNVLYDIYNADTIIWIRVRKIICFKRLKTLIFERRYARSIDSASRPYTWQNKNPFTFTRYS